MSQLSFHPAPGLGDLIAGFYVVPQNPITAAASGEPAQGVKYVPRIGELLPGKFSVPQNPIVRSLGAANILDANASNGCGCQSCNGGGNGFDFGGNGGLLIVAALAAFLFFKR